MSRGSEIETLFGRELFRLLLRLVLQDATRFIRQQLCTQSCLVHQLPFEAFGTKVILLGRPTH